MTNTVVMPLVLPSQKLDFTKIYNQLSLREYQKSFSMGMAAVKVELSPAVPVFESVIVMTISINGLLWQVGVDDCQFLLAHQIFDEEEAIGYGLDDLPVELKGALAETLVAPILEKISTTFGVPVAFEDVSFTPKSLNAVFGMSVLFKSKNMAEVGRMQLAFVPPFAAAVDDLVQLLRVLPKMETGLMTDALQDVPMTLSICAGQTVLSEEQFNDLTEGDVVLPEVWYPQTQRAELNFLCGSRTLYQAHCQYEDDVLTFLDTWNPISENEMKNTDQLEITLTFELDRKTVTVGDLKSIQAGYTFAMTNNSATPVTILANGKPVARGRLVDINGVIGVQVTDAE